MGICSSCESTHVATAKLVLQDGRLQEYSYPVKVSYVLQKNPSCFICNSDEMDFDDVVSAISEDEELQPGQLYFALPLNRLKLPLQPEEMAALAVKASAALMKSGDKCVCRKKSVCPIALPGEKSPRKMTSGGGARGGRIKKGTTSKFTALLSAIPE
ncbi:hypothetical protein EZV62_014122 [Acer yangbiense]|uniref:Uncharacterized protein n=1 Tax=Acer yangbiense TaxID=1000413 RepID=A0A5C7HRY8_9ROSI|nr:hypothetical protein EZV62_014122 [Acer yangbiense]